VLLVELFIDQQEEAEKEKLYFIPTESHAIKSTLGAMIAYRY